MTLTGYEAHIYLDVNPEPWAVGPLALGKRNGKMFPRMERNASVHAFKEAVREELERIEIEPMPPEFRYRLEFYFWRRLESYIGESGRKANAHVADATNMQKALEDALQGVLIDNDRDVQIVGSWIVEQGPDVEPGIGIYAKSVTESLEIPDPITTSRSWSLAKKSQGPSNNTWPPA